MLFTIRKAWELAEKLWFYAKYAIHKTPFALKTLIS